MAVLNKHELKRKFKRKISILEMAIKAYCFGCNGYGLDAFEDCEVWNCPLHSHRVTRGDRLSKKYKAVFKEMDNIKNGNGEINRCSWDRFFERENLATNIIKKKTNLTQIGGGVND